MKALALVTLCVCVCVCGQSCPTLCNPMDYGPPGASVCGIFHSRILECFHFLLQRIFLTQGFSPHLLCLLHCQVDSLPLGHWEAPGRIYWRLRLQEDTEHKKHFRETVLNFMVAKFILIL